MANITTIYSHDGLAAKISEDGRPPFVVTTDLIDHYGSVEATLKAVKGLRAANFLPRLGGESRPLSRLDIHYATLNQELGRRHYVWRSFTGGHVRRATGYDSCWGYGYYSGDYFLILERGADGERYVRFRVPVTR